MICIYRLGQTSINSQRITKIYNQLKVKMENSEEFNPGYFSQPSEENYGRPKKQQKYVSGENNGKWSELQHSKYIAFIQHHKDKMRSKEKRRVNKLYKEMAKYIGTRNALQCRSHHQKLEDRYLYPNKIIASYKQHNDLTLYNQLKQELEALDPKTPLNITQELKLQKQIGINARPTQTHIAEPNEVQLSESSSAPTSKATNDPSCAVQNPYAFLSWPCMQEVVSCNSFVFYPIFPIY